jgi:hypothetical protein
VKFILPMTVSMLFCVAAIGAEGLRAERAETLKSNVESLQLHLTYHGEQGKPFYRLMLSVPPAEPEQVNSFFRFVQVSEGQAERIVNHLAEEGFLNRARDAEAMAKPPAGPLYGLQVQAGDLRLAEDLGWDLAMLRRLDGLRAALAGEAAGAMDLLVGRLTGIRGQWERQADVSTSFETTARRDDTRLRFVAEGNTTVIHVHSEFGIDRATIKRKSDQWPHSLVVRMHLKGLESLRVGNGRETINLRVSSTGSHDGFTSLSVGGGELAIARGSPHWTRVQVVAGEREIPLERGYFEIPLPTKFFDANPGQITLQWVDFYR